MTRKIGIIGFGAFTREIICNIKKPFDIFVSSAYYQNIENDITNINKYYNCKVLNINNFNKNKYDALVTIADLKMRKLIIEELPKDTNFTTYVDKKSCIMDKNIEIGKGSVICAGSILTTNIKLGNFCQINLNTTIGHDTIIGNFFTSAPGVNISGNCKFGDDVYLGTNASIKEKINICDNVTIGMNTGVTKNIIISGTYIGTPAKMV